MKPKALRQSEKLSAMGSLLEDKASGTPLAQDALLIREAAERCGRIVRTFLNMARSRPAQRVPVSLNELAKVAAEMLQYGLRTHGIELTLDPALPEATATPTR